MMRGGITVLQETNDSAISFAGAVGNRFPGAVRSLGIGLWTKKSIFFIPNSPIPNSQFPNSQFPNSQFPIPQFPIPQFPIPNSPIPNSLG
ncbi:MAG: hypothetical protein F6K41_09735 [Symploca sp. SIO3E6]|nr:hypothetical protein [Caldora sp. SIO3E6]